MRDFIFKIRQIISNRPLVAAGVFSLVFFILGGAASFFLSGVEGKNIAQKNKPERQKSFNYKFTSPLLDCSYEGGPFAIRADNLRIQVTKIIEEKIKNEGIKSVSVYFRDLNNGPTMEIGGDEGFTPASLLKVPLMMAYLKKAETNPAILKMKMTYELQLDGNFGNTMQNIKPAQILESGKEYTVEELIGRMVAYSDNSAANLLLTNMEDDFLTEVYTDLGIEVPSVQKTENFMTVKEYASFFRILYNASYLDRNMSEKALQFLSESQYNDGLRSGVPTNITLAHKFGERVFDNIFQLHDCGVIYHSKSPYILCLMTRGSNFNNLADVIKNISKNVYDEIDRE